MPTILTGALDRAHVGPGSYRKYDIDRATPLIKPEDELLFTFLTELRAKVATDPRVIWYDRALQPKTDRINLAAGYAAGVTSIVVDHDEYFRIGDIVKVPRTGEVMRVDNVTAATSTLTVERSVGSTAAQALVDNDPLLIIGNSNEEGSGTRTAKIVQSTEYYNLLQIFKTPGSVTGTEDACTDGEGADNKYDREKKEKYLDHRLDIVRAFLFGERSENTAGDFAERTCGGILEFLNTYSGNWIDFGAYPTPDAFDAALEQVCRLGNKEKAFVHSGLWGLYFDKWGKEKVHLQQDETTYGMKIKKYRTSQGELTLIKSAVLEGDVYGKYGIVVDFEYLMYRYLRGRKFKFEDTSIAGIDQRQFQYLSEACPQIWNFDAHGVFVYGQ